MGNPRQMDFDWSSFIDNRAEKDGAPVQINDDYDCSFDAYLAMSNETSWGSAA